ncbi:hypothetical protein NDU88_006803 [Pleurodeles waltl]|uniref:Uncharacterized protein n=1 Tax=Pleurodeles waltl TaxID=8319 RepID=A0AAV7SQK1_PLEWA|nr:hypothetical protein NDU88_006803 [Pleurodeles waltl]
MDRMARPVQIVTPKLQLIMPGHITSNLSLTRGHYFAPLGVSEVTCTDLTGIERGSRGHCWPCCGICEVGPPPEYIESVIDLRPVRRCWAGSHGLLEQLQDSSMPCKTSPAIVRRAARHPVALQHVRPEDFRSLRRGGHGSRGSPGYPAGLLGHGTTLRCRPAVRYVWAVALPQDCHLCLCYGEQLAEVRWGALSYDLA